MFRKLLVASMIVLGLSSAAFAQANGTQQDTSAGNRPASESGSGR